MLFATPGVSLPLHALASDSNGSLYGQARVYDGAGIIVTTVSLTHVTEGLYVGSYIPASEGMYTAIYQLYTDALHTIPADYTKQIESIDVDSYRTNILRLLGLVNENSVVDQQVFAAPGKLLTARIRSYDSKTNADAAGLTGLRFTWFVTAMYTGDNLSNFKITRDL